MRPNRASRRRTVASVRMPLVEVSALPWMLLNDSGRVPGMSRAPGLTGPDGGTVVGRSTLGRDSFGTGGACAETAGAMIRVATPTIAARWTGLMTLMPISRYRPILGETRPLFKETIYDINRL